MEFSTIDTNQFHFDDPMGLTMNIINTAEAALRGMNSKNKAGQVQQPIPQSQMFYSVPAVTAAAAAAGTERDSHHQQLYYSVNFSDAHQQQHQQARNHHQQQLANTVVVSYNQANGISVPITSQPPPPPMSIPGSHKPARKSQQNSTSRANNSKTKKDNNRGGGGTHGKEATRNKKQANSIHRKPSKKAKEQGRRYTCRFCDAGLSSKEHLQSHYNTVHLDKLKFACSHCTKRFARSDQKNRHEAIHNPHRFQGDKLKYPCRHCTKKFARSDQRKRHEAIHDPNRFQGEPAYSCDFCDKKYHLKGSLDGHRKRQHLGYTWKRKPKGQQ